MELSLSREYHQILCEITVNQIQTKDGVRQSVTSVEGSVCDTLSQESITVSIVRPRAYIDKTVWITSTLIGGRGKQQSAIAIKVGAVDLEGRPLGSTPRSPRHEGGNAHLSKNTLSQNGYGTQQRTPVIRTQDLCCAHPSPHSTPVVTLTTCGCSHFPFLRPQVGPLLHQNNRRFQHLLARRTFAPHFMTSNQS